MSTLLSSLKFLSKSSVSYILGVPLASCAFIAAYYFLFGANTHNGSYIGGIILSVICMMSLAVCMNFYACYGNIAQSMGATRKSYFAASQIMKVTVCVSLFVAILLSNATLNFFYKIDFLKDNSSVVIALFGFSLILGTIGETVGIICTRWGRIGMMIYIGVCLLFGAAVGVMMVISMESVIDIVSFIMQSPLVMLSIMILFSAAMAFVNAILYKKSVVI